MIIIIIYNYYKVKMRISDYIIENITLFAIVFTKTIRKNHFIHFKLFVMNRKPRCL
jgi:hypothetical protein